MRNSKRVSLKWVCFPLLRCLVWIVLLFILYTRPQIFFAHFSFLQIGIGSRNKYHKLRFTLTHISRNRTKNEQRQWTLFFCCCQFVAVFFVLLMLSAFVIVVFPRISFFRSFYLQICFLAWTFRFRPCNCKILWSVRHCHPRQNHRSSH